MWILTKGSLLVPTVFERDRVPSDIAQRYEIQVASRSRDHLEAFCVDYMPIGEHSEVHVMPAAEYQFVFYTTRVAFAEAVRLAILEIDYMDFEPKVGNHGYRLMLEKAISP